jgi:hypothetical protein
LRALLWSIFFQRTLDNCEPDTFELLDTHIVGLIYQLEVADRQVYSPSKEVEREIEGKIAEFLKVYSERGADTGEVGSHVPRR